VESATSEILRAARGTLIVQPSLVDNSEGRTASGLFVAGALERSPVYRGVILSVGAHLEEPQAEEGAVVLYSHYVELGVGNDAVHLVASQHILAFA
jgi:hypothetical protein